MRTNPGNIYEANDENLMQMRTKARNTYEAVEDAIEECGSKCRIARLDKVTGELTLTGGSYADRLLAKKALARLPVILK